MRPGARRKFKLPYSDTLQLLAEFIEVINDDEFCVGCAGRRRHVESLHKLYNCPLGIANHKDLAWREWKKTLIFPNGIGICGGCGVNQAVRASLLTALPHLISGFQGKYSDKNNEEEKLIHNEAMGPNSCPHRDGMRIFAWVVLTNPELSAAFQKSQWGPDKPITGARTWQSWIVKAGKNGVPTNIYNIALWWIDTFGMPAVPV